MVPSVVCSLFDGFNISSVNVMLYKWGSGEISNTGSKDLSFLEGGYAPIGIGWGAGHFGQDTWIMRVD